MFFYTEGAKAYYFEADDLSESATYRLRGKVGENGVDISAEANLVSDFAVQSPFSFIPEIGLANFTSSEQNNYPSLTLSWNTGLNGKRYEVSARLHWMEFYSPTDSMPKSLNWRLGTYKASSVDGDETLAQVIDGESFFRFVAANVQPDPNVMKRVIRNMDFSITVAGEDLNTYMEVNEPKQRSSSRPSGVYQH